MNEKLNLSGTKPLHIIIAGGGTGGHIFPAVAIARALQKKLPEIKFLFVGAKGKMEMEKIPEAGFEIQGINIAGYNRSALLKNWSLPFKLLQSYFDVKKIFNQFRPDAVIGVGGYSSFPVLREAQARSIPTFIHESNSFAGKSNILLGKKATRVFVASNGMERFFPKEKITITGNPVRSIFSENISKEIALEFFGLTIEQPVVLVIGGSLGAQSINEVIQSNLSIFDKNKWQLIWQTGKNFSGPAAAEESERKNIWTNAFINKMEMAYSAADVVIARSGAMTVAELSMTKKPSILVPYPHAAEDHQTANAKQMVDMGAAILVPDSKVKEALMPALTSLINDRNKLAEMAASLNKPTAIKADDYIADEIFNFLKDKN